MSSHAFLGAPRSVQPRSETWIWVALSLVVLAYSLAFIGHRPLADPDEGRYASAAWEMAQRGDYLVPKLAGRPHLSKSPAAYWPVAGGIAWFGRSETALRAGVGMAMALWVLVTAACARLVFGSVSAAIVAAAVLGTSALPFVGGSLLTADPWLALACAAAAAAGTLALLRPMRRRLGARLFWVCLGLAFFVKGPPGLLPLAGMIWAWPRRRQASAADRWVDPLGVTLGVALGLWWYVAMIVLHPPALRLFLHDELYARIFSAELRRNGPAWLPLAMLIAGTLPWNLSLLLRWRAWRVILAEPWLRLLSGWVVAGLLVFTISRSRQPLYVLPLTTAVAVVSGGIIARWFHQSRIRKMWVAGLAAVLALGWTSVRYDAARLPMYRQSRDLSALVAVRRAQAPDGVALLQTRLSPGLEFYLGQPLLYVAWKRADRGEPHEFDREQLLAQMRAGRRFVVVGRAAAFSRFPSDLELLDRVHDPASEMDVARVVTATPRAR